MALTNLSRAADRIRGYMGRVFLWDGSTWVDAGDVMSPQIQIEPVLDEADSQGRQRVTSYDFTAQFSLKTLSSTVKSLLSGNQKQVTIFFSKDPEPENKPTYSAGNWTGVSDGFLIVNAWLVVNASINMAGEGDAYEVQLTFRALPSDAAGLFDGTQNKIVLP